MWDMISLETASYAPETLSRVHPFNFQERIAWREVYTLSPCLSIIFLSDLVGLGASPETGIQQGCIFRTTAEECGVLELQADSVV